MNPSPEITPETTLVIITGITAGIGEAIGRTLAESGFAIYGIARNAEKLRALDVPMVGTEVRDLSLEADVRACLSGLDLTPWSRAVLINNAGSLDPVGRFDSIDLSVTNRTMMLNGLAPILVSQTFYQAVLAAPTCTGRIIQITSGAALRPIAGWTSYCMSKAAMWMGTQVMAEEMDVTRCQVMALSPGVVATAMQTQIRGETEASMPGVAWFRQIAAEGKLADPSVPALRIRAMLSDDATGRKAFPHGESVDLFAA